MFAFEKRNITVLATLTRLQTDCVLRTFAMTLVDDSEVFSKEVLLENKQINKIKDKKGNKMTDKYLCEQMGEFFDLPIYDYYQQVCGFVHFSSSSLKEILRTDENDEYKITMFISRENREEEIEKYTNDSIRIANAFYFFGSILIDILLDTWLKQEYPRKDDAENENE